MADLANDKADVQDEETPGDDPGENTGGNNGGGSGTLVDDPDGD